MNELIHFEHFILIFHCNNHLINIFLQKSRKSCALLSEKSFCHILSLNLSLTSWLKNVGCWANITSIVKGRDPFEPEGRPILYESLVALFVPLNRSRPWVGVHPTINLNIDIFVDLTTIGERHWRCIKDIQLNILFSNLKKIKFSILKLWNFNFSYK